MSRYSIEVMVNTQQDTADVARISSDVVAPEVDLDALDDPAVHLRKSHDGDDPVPVDTPAGSVEEG